MVDLYPKSFAPLDLTTVPKEHRNALFKDLNFGVYNLGDRIGTEAENGFLLMEGTCSTLLILLGTAIRSEHEALRTFEQTLGTETIQKARKLSSRLQAVQACKFVAPEEDMEYEAITVFK